MDGSVIGAPPDQGLEQRLRRKCPREPGGCIKTRLHFTWRSPSTSRHLAAAVKASFFQGSLEIFMIAEQSGMRLRISRRVCRLPEQRLRGEFRHRSVARRPTNPIPAFDANEGARFPGCMLNETAGLDRLSHDNRPGAVSDPMNATSRCS